MTLALTIQTPTDEEQKGGTIELPAEIFDVDANVSLLHQVVVAQLAAARQGTHATKTRGEVRGGGKKPYRQKGTGRARQGSNRAPQFAGGGVVHGPQPRNYEQRTPKKMKAAALRCALSDRARGERVFVVSSLVAGDTPSTKAAAATLAKVSGAKHVLVVAERTDELTWKSLRNVPTVHLLEPGQLNTYDVLVSDDVVFTQGALESFLAGPAKGKSANPDPTTSAGESTDAAGTPGAGAASSAEIAEVAEQTIEADEDAEAAVAVSIEKPAKKAPAKKAAPKKVAPKKVAPKQADAAEAVEASDEEDGN